MHLVLLGPVGLYRNGSALPMLRPQQATVLAALAVDAGRAVPVGTLVDRVWRSSPPPAARRSLQAHIARIKQTLLAGDVGTVERTRSGYLLDVDPDRVDLHRFNGLIRAAGAAVDDRARAELFADALQLWQGVPLAGITGVWAAGMRETWTRQYLEAVAGWARAELTVGRAGAVAGPLAEVATAHPAAETVIGELMRALHRTGRTAEALARFAALREHLADELGAEPGEPLRRLHLELLHDNVTPPAKTPDSGMPAVVPGFVGRDRELGALDGLLPSGPADPTRAVVVSGMAGVGKTTLAVRWARRVTHRFADGGFYLNLRGFDPRGTAMTPSEALFAVLEALGVDARRIPSSLDGRAGLYRSTIAGRRMLLVFDNVRDPDQVRPLLPGSPGCLVVMTSRNRLTSLVATEGAASLTVDPFTDQEARELVTHRLHAARLDTDPVAVDRLVALCSGLPLAMAIVAARAATYPELGLAVVTGGGPTSLDAFDSGDPVINMRSVFSWSFRALTPPAAHVFRLLGLHPGQTVTVTAAASLAGLPPAAVRPALAELTHAYLLTEPVAGRYAMHDLLRAYAVESAATGPLRAAATRRLLDHYLHTAHLADRLMRPDRDALAEAPAAPAPEVTVEPLADDRAALDWCSTEYAAALAAAEQAAAGGYDRHAWQLVWCLENYVDFTGRWREFEPALRSALAASERHGDPVGTAQIHRGIARICVRTDRFAEAVDHLQEAVALFTAAGSDAGLIGTHRSLGVALVSLGRHREGFEHERLSLQLAEDSGDPAAQALTLNNLGFHSALVGLADQARDYGERALALQRRLRNRNGEARALGTVAFAYSLLGRHGEALNRYERGIQLFGELGDRTSQAELLSRYGDAYKAAGDLARARQSWERALHLFDSIGEFDLLGNHDGIVRVRERLAAV